MRRADPRTRGAHLRNAQMQHQYGMYMTTYGRNRLFVPGNVIVVKHAERLFSAYALLQPGKLRVSDARR